MGSYDIFARLYDLEHRSFNDDLALYHNYAQRCDGPVLELGCGSGRVSVALAQAGFDVVGVDNSASMLSIARQRAAEGGVAGRVRFELGDVCTLDYERRFALAVYPLNGFLHLLAVEDQLAALGCARRALLPGGLLIVDLPNPHTVFAPASDGVLSLRSRFQSPEGHSISCFASAQTDLAAQLQRLTLMFDEVAADGVVHRTTVETDLRFVYRFEMESLLRQAGFDVDGVHGTYDLDTYEADSTIMLFVAHR